MEVAQKCAQKDDFLPMTRKNESAILVLSQNGIRQEQAVSEAFESFEKRLFCCPKSKRRRNSMNVGLKKSDRLKTVYWSMVSILSAALISLQPVMADTIWDRFSSIMRDVYGQLVGISTIVAVTVAAIALIVRMISRNQRAVDEATSWLKRIVVTWIVLNSLGFVVAYLQPLIAGGNYTG